MRAELDEQGTVPLACGELRPTDEGGGEGVWEGAPTRLASNCAVPVPVPGQRKSSTHTHTRTLTHRHQAHTPVLWVLCKQARVQHRCVGRGGAVLAAHHAEGELRLRQQKCAKKGEKPIKIMKVIAIAIVIVCVRA